MNSYVFVGPTLNREEIESTYDVICLPPAAQGDVYRICQLRPRAIGIIDGYFEGVPSVWHKEILWAMAEGIHVFGSASMGALRAAELHSFGMHGIGHVFEQFRDDVLEDDDEVAILHGPAEMNYAPLSEPMVNIRTTLEQASREGVIDPGTADRLIRSGKKIFYQERTWTALINNAADDILDDGSLDKLTAWLEQGKIDIKRRDALEMLSTMQQFVGENPEPKQVNFDFEWTEMWDSVVFRNNSVTDITDGSRSISDEQVLDELRLQPDAFERVTLRAALRYLILDEARRTTIQIDQVKLKNHINQFRIDHELFTRKDLDRFLEKIHTSAETFDRLIEDELLIEEWILQLTNTLDAHRLDYLRASGEYAGLADRAQRKNDMLASSPGEIHTPQGLGLIPMQLVEGYFRQIGQSVPENLDDYIRYIGLDTREAFHRLLAEEYVYFKPE
jgi:hypothetical protein